MDGTETNLFEEFTKVQKLLSKYQLLLYRKFGPSGNPHRGQGRVLAILKLQPEISQKELGYLLDMRNQSLGELLGKLEKAGAVIREPSEDDRRSMNIKLTEYGAKLASQGSRNPEDVGKAFDCLSPEDRKKLHEILLHLSAELESLVGKDEAGSRDRHREKSADKSGRRRGEEKRADQKGDVQQ